jgi:hypothetical protein
MDEDTEFESKVLESFLQQSLLDFERARMFEYMVEVYKLLIPMCVGAHFTPFCSMPIALYLFLFKFSTLGVREVESAAGE